MRLPSGVQPGVAGLSEPEIQSLFEQPTDEHRRLKNGAGRLAIRPMPLSFFKGFISLPEDGTNLNRLSNPSVLEGLAGRQS
jgi:hypothetical protein